MTINTLFLDFASEDTKVVYTMDNLYHQMQRIADTVRGGEGRRRDERGGKRRRGEGRGGEGRGEVRVLPLLTKLTSANFTKYFSRAQAECFVIL